MDTNNNSLCLHTSKGGGEKFCPISKSTCPFECLYGEILGNIELGIIVFDTNENEVIFQNRAAINLFRGAAKTKDFEALCAILLPNLKNMTDDDFPYLQKTMFRDNRYLGYSVYKIIEGYLWIFVRDISDQVEQEKYVSLLVAAVEATDEAIVITDSDCNIQYVNPAFERVTGYTPEEALGMNYCREYGKDMLKKLKREGSWMGQVTGKRKDNTAYIEDVVIFPVKGHMDEVRNYVIAKRDVTEKTRLESLADAMNVMDNIGYVFSGIRHELGNPINSLKMSLSVLKNNIDTFSKNHINEYINRSVEQITRVEYILKSLKSFNMFENPELQSVELRPFMEDFLSLVKGDLEKNGIETVLIIHPEVQRGFTDPRALQQVFLNITSNASDALEGIEDPKIIISMHKRNNSIHIYFTDNGCGMSEGEQDDLFKPFHTTKTTGTGLGLVITSKMLGKMGASIMLSSDKNAGTIVDIAIPEKIDEPGGN